MNKSGPEVSTHTSKTSPLPPAPQKLPRPQSRAGLLALSLHHLKERALDSRVARAHSRYTNVRSNLLAGGIAYTALFSLGALITLLVNSLRVFLSQIPLQAHTVYLAIDRQFPGLISLDGKPGLIDPRTIASPNFSWDSLVALVVALLAGMRVVGALRSSIQAVFGLGQRAQAFWKPPLRDFIMFLVLGVCFILALVFYAGSLMLLSNVFFPGLVGAILNVCSIALVCVINACMVALALRFLAGVRADVRELWKGAAGFSLLATLLQFFGTFLVAKLDPVVASFAAVLTLILWVNLLTRLFLLTCAFIANPPRVATETLGSLHFEERPNFVTLNEAETLKWPYDPATGQIWSREEEIETAKLAEQLIAKQTERQEDEDNNN